MELIQQMMEIPVDHMANVFGKFDAWLKLIEKNLRVTAVVRDGNLKVMGEEAAVDSACAVIRQLTELSL